MCVVSTHLDDAVLSCGAAIAAWDRPLVVTVFTDAPPVERTDGWNHATTGERFAPASQAIRRREDAAALAVLGAEPAWLGLHEAEYRPDGQDVAELAAAIRSFLDRHDLLDVVAPLGLRHPDHLAVADACRLLMRDGSRRRWRLALDLPYARTFPDLVGQRLDLIRSEGFGLLELEAIPVEGTPKSAAVAAYASQIAAVRGEHPELDAALLDPERSWRVAPAGGADPGPSASTIT